MYYNLLLPIYSNHTLYRDIKFAFTYIYIYNEKTLDRFRRARSVLQLSYISISGFVSLTDTRELLPFMNKPYSTFVTFMLDRQKSHSAPVRRSNREIDRHEERRVGPLKRGRGSELCTVHRSPLTKISARLNLTGRGGQSPEFSRCQNTNNAYARNRSMSGRVKKLALSLRFLGLASVKQLDLGTEFKKGVLKLEK